MPPYKISRKDLRIIDILPPVPGYDSRGRQAGHASGMNLKIMRLPSAEAKKEVLSSISDLCM